MRDVDDEDMTLEEWREHFDDVAAWLDLGPGDPTQFDPTRIANAWSMLPRSYFRDHDDGRGPIDNLRLMTYLRHWLDQWIPRAIDQAARQHGQDAEEIARWTGLDVVDVRAAWIHWAWRFEVNVRTDLVAALVDSFSATAEQLGCLGYWQARPVLPGPEDVPGVATIAGRLHLG